jgi:hypothetical protein
MIADVLGKFGIYLH